MILINSTKRYFPGERREEKKFAWFPIQMKQSRDDVSGEVIWLESYIHIDEKSTSEVFPWNLIAKERLSAYTLRKLEK